MKHIVLDASVTLALLLNEKHVYAEKILDEYLSLECIAHVPYLWHLEIRNILLLKEKKGVFQDGYMEKSLQILDKFIIRTDQPGDLYKTMIVIESICRQYGLTTYDAGYIELALRIGAPIVTLDQDMIQAARDLSCFLE